jgi:hypothetical protein
MAVRMPALRSGRALLPRNMIFLLLELISVRVCVDSQCLAWPEGLRKLKKFIHFTGSRTRDVPGCGIVPQRTTLPRAPNIELSK